MTQTKCVNWLICNSYLSLQKFIIITLFTFVHISPTEFILSPTEHTQHLLNVLLQILILLYFIIMHFEMENNKNHATL